MLKALEEIPQCFRSYLPIKGSSLVSVSHLVLSSTLGSGVLIHSSQVRRLRLRKAKLLAPGFVAKGVVGKSTISP